MTFNEFYEEYSVSILYVLLTLVAIYIIRLEQRSVQRDMVGSDW